MKQFYWLAVWGILFSGTLLMGAEGLRTLPDSAEAMGMVGGRFANLKDPSVTRTNPASLADLEGTTFQFNFQPWYGETDFTSSTGVQDSMIIPWKYLGSSYLSYELNEKMTAGLGFSAPFGVSINWPRYGAFRYAAPYDAVLQTFALNPAIGIEVNDRLNIGFGLDVLYSRIKLDQAYSWLAATGFPFRDGDMTFEGTGWGLGGYLGITYEIADNQRLAITGRLPVKVNYEGDFEISNVPAPVMGVFTPESRFKSDITYPGSIGVGYGWDVTNRLTLGADFEWIQNSTHDNLPLNIGTNQALLGGATALPLNWKNSISAGVGMSYQIADDAVFRAGYLYSESPMKNSTYSPSVPANDRHIFSVGFGKDLDSQTRLDLAYSLIYMEDRTVSGALNPAFNGNYDYLWSIITVGITKSF